MYQAFFKRLTDIALSIIALLLLSPILILTTICIKVCDHGPIIFVQRRIGRHGQTFFFFKFRSMPVNTGDIPSDQIGALKLTWIGSLIRRTNIDELPQLLNILCGDMSIVGPRPALPSQTELTGCRQENGALGCRPGLTGLAQVNAYDGMSTGEKAVFDGRYASAITFRNDVSIVLKTFLYLLKPPPRY